MTINLQGWVYWFGNKVQSKPWAGAFDKIYNDHSIKVWPFYQRLCVRRFHVKVILWIKIIIHIYSQFSSEISYWTGFFSSPCQCQSSFLFNNIFQGFPDLPLPNMLTKHFAEISKCPERIDIHQVGENQNAEWTKCSEPNAEISENANCSTHAIMAIRGWFACWPNCIPICWASPWMH